MTHQASPSPTSVDAEVDSLRRELERTRRELAESHQGLLTLHAELEDRSDALRRMVDVKSRVVANVSHEFRTPINSILGLTQILLDRLDGPLTSEQEKQLRFVRASGEVLSELVNDLLDLTRIEAGHHQLRTRRSTVDELFVSLRGMIRPLFTSSAVQLVVEREGELAVLDTDVGKIAQVLRNLISNALKFTEQGEIRVRAFNAEGGLVSFSVTDSGIGIAAADLERIFDEFTQIDGPVQRRVHGTGLGLALSRRLAEVLGGTLSVQSGVGLGSTFTLTIPAVHEEVQVIAAIEEKSRVLDPERRPVLIIEDDRQTMFLYERYLASSGFQVIPARTIEDARAAIERTLPSAILLDVMLEAESTWTFLGELKDNPRTRTIPVVVLTVIDREQKARALGADEFWLKPVDGDRLIQKLGELAGRSAEQTLLIIDDDEPSRYLMRRLLGGTNFRVLETDSGRQGLLLARREKPDLILLDFLLKGETAFDVIDALKADPATRTIPVIIQTARDLGAEERARLARETSGIIEKQTLSRELALTRVREALEARLRTTETP